MGDPWTDPGSTRGMSGAETRCQSGFGRRNPRSTPGRALSERRLRRAGRLDTNVAYVLVGVTLFGWRLELKRVPSLRLRAWPELRADVAVQALGLYLRVCHPPPFVAMRGGDE